MSIVSVLHEWQCTLLDLALPFCSRYKGEVFVKERNQTKVELVKLLVKLKTKNKTNKSKLKLEIIKRRVINHIYINTISIGMKNKQLINKFK